MAIACLLLIAAVIWLAPGLRSPDDKRLISAALVLFSSRAFCAEPVASSKETLVRAVLSEDIDDQVELLKKLALASDESGEA